MSYIKYCAHLRPPLRCVASRNNKTEDAEIVFLPPGRPTPSPRVSPSTTCGKKGMKVGMVSSTHHTTLSHGGAFAKTLSRFKSCWRHRNPNMGLGSVSSGGFALRRSGCGPSMKSPKRPLIMSFMAGMGGEAIVLKEFYWMAQKNDRSPEAWQDRKKRTHWVGFEE